MSPGEPLIRWDWVLSHLPDIAQRLQEHIVLAGIAVSVGFAISFALALLIRRLPVLNEPITWVSGVIYTIPSLAVFALLIPFTGLTLLTAEIGLTSYTLVVLVRSIVSGLQSVPADIREAALGAGFTPRQLLWRVELPLALPIIVAGLRVTTVSIIGLTTVTALIGQGGGWGFSFSTACSGSSALRLSWAPASRCSWRWGSTRRWSRSNAGQCPGRRPDRDVSSERRRLGARSRPLAGKRQHPSAGDGACGDVVHDGRYRGRHCAADRAFLRSHA